MDFLRTAFRTSIRRACRVLRFDCSTYHYRSVRPEQAVLRKRIREIAETHTRYGYRKIWAVLRREGWTINHKRVYRLYCQETLQMRYKVPKRRVSAKLRDDRLRCHRAERVLVDGLHERSSVRWETHPRAGGGR